MAQHELLPQHVILETADMLRISAGGQHHGLAEHHTRVVQWRLHAGETFQCRAFTGERTHLTVTIFSA